MLSIYFTRKSVAALKVVKKKQVRIIIPNTAADSQCVSYLVFQVIVQHLVKSRLVCDRRVSLV